ncbi:MAG: Maf family protein [Fibrobacteraceae bacterium]
MLNVILASASPRRMDILRQLRIPFRAEPSHFSEDGNGRPPQEWPLYFSEGKALEVSMRFPSDYVLGFDTLVFLDSLPFGKPKDRAQAMQMLTLLNGKTHSVVTGVALAKNGKIVESSEETTFVTFRNVSPKELETYVDSKEPMDKAGAYAIQGLGARLVFSINGCFYNVVGLPVARTLNMLERLGDLKCQK